jgi:hypothetical protein
MSVSGAFLTLLQVSGRPLVFAQGSGGTSERSDDVVGLGLLAKCQAVGC